MRFQGKLDKWNDDRGFGFITPLSGDEPVFVHVSAFARDGRRPKLGETVSFEVEPAGDGKKRATNVQRAGARRDDADRAQPARSARDRRGAASWRSRFPMMLILLALGVFAYQKVVDRGAPPSAGRSAVGSASAGAPAFRCDGRTHCSQMTSCEEAKFFLRNCPGTKMDGNRDGVPCERQWCTGGWR
jgi:cold shock CspA family protein